MTRFTRRCFVHQIGASAAAMACASLVAPRALSQAKPKVVVIGGGAGGATVARAVHRQTSGAIAVTLIEPQRTYTTPFFSNLYVGGLRDLQSITHGYDRIRSEGVTVVHEKAAAVDRDRRHVVLASGERLPYDRLVVAPGI